MNATRIQSASTPPRTRHDVYRKAARLLAPTGLILLLCLGCAETADRNHAPETAPPDVQPMTTTVRPASQPDPAPRDESIPEPAAGPDRDPPLGSIGEDAANDAVDSESAAPSADSPPESTADEDSANPRRPTSSEHDNFDLFEVVIDRYRRTPDPHRDPQ